jgi:YVTN family beta-propeller protein
MPICLRAVAIAAVVSSTALAQPTDSVDAEGAPYVHKDTWPENRPLPPGWYGARLVTEHIDVNSQPEGDIPRELAFTPDGSTVVIVNHGTGQGPGMMTFFDVNTRTITHSVTVGLLPSHVAVSPNGQFAVCSNVFSHDVSVVHIPTRTLLASVPVTGTQPFRVAITPDSLLAVVAVTNDAVTSAFSVIDLTTRTEVRTIPTVSQGAIGGFFTPESGISSPLWTKFALTPDGTTIVLPHRTNGAASVRLYDVASGALVSTLPTSSYPTSVDVSGDGTVAVVGHEFGTRRISRIDLAARTLTQLTIAEDLSEQVIRITPDKTHAISTAFVSPSTVTLFHDLSTGATAASIVTGVVGDIELSHDGQYAFVSNFNAAVIRIATRSLVRTIPFAACAESACSPTQLRAVALNNRFREDIHVYNINGASGFFEGFALTGEPPEADATRNLAVSPDGQVVVAGNNTSRNVAVIDGPTRSVLGYVNTGDRILDVAVTPDGRYAVVCNTEENTVSVVDTQTLTRVANLSCPQRPAKVKLSADGTKAYVLSVAGTDLIYFINLAGAASSIAGTAIAGQTGSANGYTYTETSGIELSPDGSMLAVCRSFDDTVRLLNTTTRTVIADVPVGIDPGTMEFPIRAAFSPAGNRLYVSMSFGDAVAVVNINGAASALIATAGGVDFPLTLNVDPAGQFVYVGNQGSSPMLRVLDTSSNSYVRFIGLNGGSVRAAALNSGVLYAAGLNNTTGGQFYRVTAAGPASSLIDQTPLTSNPSDMAFCAATQKAYVAQPVPDGVDEVFVGTPCGTADFDCDGDVGTDADIESFFACLAGTCPAPPCQSTADFNGDGDVGTDADIEAFFRVLGGGDC